MIRPFDYGLEWEIEGIKHTAEVAGLKGFHFVEYSDGLSLAFTARYHEWVKGLAMIEPGWIADDMWQREEAHYWSEFGRMMALPPEERLRAGMALNVRSGLQAPSPPPGPHRPGWLRELRMVQRCNGITTTTTSTVSAFATSSSQSIWRSAH
jgi:hypothetical protein